MDPRILIVEENSKYRHMLRRYVVQGLKGSSVKATSSALAENQESAFLSQFDVLLVGCDFSEDGTQRNPVLAAVRAISADPRNPPIIILAAKGSEFTAVQAMRSGASDYIARTLMDREQVIAAINRVLSHHPDSSGGGEAGQELALFGYDMRACLARSDDGSVHVAYSAEQNREVVLKVLRRGRGSMSQDEKLQEFIREFTLLADIDDPSTAQIYDFRASPSYCFMAMEYFPIGHLGVRMQSPLPPEQALELIEEVAHGLQIIHAAGVVHLDLKPGNIMLREDGTIALIDFGISKSTTGGEESTVQPREGVIGTPYYMSPEQADGAQTDERSDLYAVGVILHEMLLGEKPFVGDSPTAILESHRAEPIPKLPNELQDLQPLLDRLLAKDPEQRIGSARQLIETIESLRARLQAA
jgi:serine/threonine protein kinase